MFDEKVLYQILFDLRDKGYAIEESHVTHIGDNQFEIGITELGSVPFAGHGYTGVYGLVDGKTKLLRTSSHWMS